MSTLQEVLVTQGTAIQHLLGSQVIISDIIAKEMPNASFETLEFLKKLEDHNKELIKLVGETGKKIYHV